MFSAQDSGIARGQTLRVAPLKADVTKTRNGERGTGNGERGTGSRERGAGNGERKSGNELSAETSTKIQNGGPKNEREKEEDKERNSCVG